MIKDTRIQSTNRLTSKLLVKVALFHIVLVKEKIVAIRFITKIIGILRQDFCIDLTTPVRMKILGGRIRNGKTYKRSASAQTS